jgi:hypothetical protein
MTAPKPAAAPDQVTVSTSPAAFLQRVSDALRSGLTWYVRGTVPEAKWAGIEAKMRARYPTLSRDRKFLHRERKAGRPAVRLLVLQPRGKAAGLIEFALVSASPVQGDGEAWRDGTRDRLQVWAYEAVRQTRPGSDEPAWTWRVQKARYDALRAELIERVRKHQDAALAALAASTKGWPGFAPVRKQHRALGLLLAGEWKRSRAYGTTPPNWPRLGYVRRLASTTNPLPAKPMDPHAAEP